MKQNLFWKIIIVIAVIVGLYPFLYFFIDRKFGLLDTKTTSLLNDTIWNIFFYIHIVLGGIALLIGWPQFNAKWRNQKPQLHKNIGKLYVVAVLLSALSGIYIGFFATGGIISASGFITLGIFWFVTTFKSYLDIKNRKIIAHQKMMLYSYAMTLAAVSLRLWLPLLTLVFGDFFLAYKIVAWICWIPNLIVANFLVKKLDKKKQ